MEDEITNDLPESDDDLDLEALARESLPENLRVGEEPVKVEAKANDVQAEETTAAKETTAEASADVPTWLTEALAESGVDVSKIDPAELKAEIAKALADERAAVAQADTTTKLRDELKPYSDELAAKVEAGTLDLETAKELLAARKDAVEARLERDALKSERETVNRERDLEKIATEFPGADRDDLKEFAAAGKSLNDVRALAERQHTRAEKLKLDAIANYNADKTADAAGAHVPATTSGGRPQTREASPSDSYVDHFGL
jgi:hypothetical protein